MIDVGTGIGSALSLVLFIMDQISGKMSTVALLQEINADRTIRDYLEWFRRQNHDELIQRINTNEAKLLRELGRMGSDLHGLCACLVHELRESHDVLAERIRDLNARFPPPVLSPVPLRTRALTDVPLLARESELVWLQNVASDAIVSGQPGSGKTYLLYHFAQQHAGRFVLTNDPDTAVGAVINGCPPVLIVDDAARRIALIQRLLHLRRENGLSFRLIAICWPFELEDILCAMAIPESSVLELPLLSRIVIADLIQSVIKAAGYKAPNAFVREINNQAVGRPGLAVALTQASLLEDLQAVMRGETLAQKMGRLFESIVGRRAAQIIAAFSVGGKAGMEMDAVSRVIEMPIVDLHAALKEMAPGGVLEPLSKTRLMAVPSAMRRAMLKDVFFKPDAICLPQSIYKALLNSAPDRDAALNTLLDSVHVGAEVNHGWLQSLISTSGSAKVWDAYAWLGSDQCRYIIANHPEMIVHVIEPALHFIPDVMIPRLLDSPVNDIRPLNINTETPLRKLADWVSHAKVGTPDPVKRRRDLFAAIKIWVGGGGSRHTAFRALKSCFSLGYEMTDSDPGDGMRLTISSGLLPLGDVEAIADLWPEFLDIARCYGVSDWKSVTSIISGWLHPQSQFGHQGGDAYREKTLPVARRMMEDCIGLAEGHNGFLRWAYMHAMDAGLDSSAIPVNPEYLQLYPVERLSGNWQAKEEINARNAATLADSWKDLPFKDFIARMRRYESEAASMDHNWPRLSTIVCRLFAERREFTEKDIVALIDSGVPADLVDPFLIVSFEKGTAVDAALRDCIGRQGYQQLAVCHTITGRAPHLYPEITQILPEFSLYIEHMAYRCAIPEQITRLLLNHDDIRVRLSAALMEFRSDPKGQVRDNLKPIWRTVVIQGIAANEGTHDLLHIHDLDEIIAYDRTLAFDTLMAMAKRGEHSLSMWDLEPIMPLLFVLSSEEKQNLLNACENLDRTEIPRVLIGEDVALYRKFLKRPEMNRHFLTPLIGSPTDAGWIDKALVALEAGFSPKEIALAARGWHWGGSGPMSRMWQKWIDNFQPLVGHANPQVQTIGSAGVEWSTVERDQELKSEKREAIHGCFSE